MKYIANEDVEILGEVRTAGSEVEIDEETAAPFVDEGKLSLADDATPGDSTPADTTPDAPVAPSETPDAPVGQVDTPAADTAPSAAAENDGEKDGQKPDGDNWAGGHTV